jgi:hypothetical protein
VRNSKQKKDPKKEIVFEVHSTKRLGQLVKSFVEIKNAKQKIFPLTF